MSLTTDPRAARAFTETRVFEALARTGYVARGVIYLLLGFLALRLAQGAGEHRPNQQGAFQKIAEQPLGHAALVLVAIGLAGYALWRLAQASIGHTPEYGEHSRFDRIGAAASGLVYAVLRVLAVSVLRGTAGNSSATPRQTTAGVLQWPAGRELVAAAGAALICVAAYQAYLGLSRKFLGYSKTAEMTARTRATFTLIGTVGLVARAIAFALIGMFVIKAAIDFRPKEAVGIDGALARLTQHAYGTAALCLVACGLVAFGIYSTADARYRKI